MPMLLSDIYEYVYSGRAKIDVSRIKNPAQQEVAKTKSKQAITKKFSDVIDFNPDRFNAYLKQTNEELRQILFDQTLADDAYFAAMPSDEEIAEQLNALNQKYQLIDKIDPDYVKIFKACKLIGDYVECNNDIDNQLAYLHAYKIMAIFASTNKKESTLQNFERYIKKYDLENAANPICDALFYSLPVNLNQLNVDTWRNIIQNNGPQAFKLFELANKVKENLGKDPDNLNQIVSEAEKTKFKKHDEYPELAKLCYRYNVPEKVFNEALIISSSVKTQDFLPDVVIEGKDYGFKDYYLTKLPINDPRAYILGYITNCCQSIGGDAENCAIDGITLPTNGFYVLLKKKDTKKNVQPFNDKKGINYNEFDLVGQGYAWLSTYNNLTIDSWENLRPEADNKVASKLLKEFAKHIVENKFDVDIKRVNLGCGGKTPDELQKLEHVAFPEQQKAGIPYGDSSEQVTLYGKDEKEKNQNSLNSVLDKAIEQYPSIADQLTLLRRNYKKYGFPDSEVFVRQFHDFFLMGSMPDFWKSDRESKLLATINLVYEEPNKRASIWHLMPVLHRAGILNDSIDDIITLVQEQNYGHHVAALNNLMFNGVNNKEIFKLIIKNKDVKFYTESIIKLVNAGLGSLENIENLIQLVNSFDDVVLYKYPILVVRAVESLTEAIIKLSEKNLYKPEWGRYFISNINKVMIDNMTDYFLLLQRGGYLNNDKASEAYINLIREHDYYKMNAIRYLLANDLYDDNLRELILTSPSNAKLIELIKNIPALTKAKLYNPDIMKFINSTIMTIPDQNYAGGSIDAFISSLILLHQNGLFNGKYKALLAEKSVYNSSVWANEVVTLKKSNLLLNDKVSLLLDKINAAEILPAHLAELLIICKKHQINIDDDSFVTLYKKLANQKSLDTFVEAIKKLSDKNLFSEDDFHTLQDFHQLGSIIEVLKSNKLLISQYELVMSKMKLFEYERAQFMKNLYENLSKKTMLTKKMSAYIVENIAEFKILGHPLDDENLAALIAQVPQSIFHRVAMMSVADEDYKSRLIFAMHLLNKNNIATEQLCNYIIDQFDEPLIAVRIILFFKENDLLDKTFMSVEPEREELTALQLALLERFKDELHGLEMFLRRIRNYQPLTRELFNKISDVRGLYIFDLFFSELYKEKIKLFNVDVIFNCPHLLSSKDALKMLSDNNLHTEAYEALIFKHPYPKVLADVIIKLHDSSLLDKVLEVGQPDLFLAIHGLYQNNIAPNDFIDMLSRNPNQAISNAIYLIQLKENGLLTDKAIQSINTEDFYSVYGYIAKLVSQEMAEKLLIQNENLQTQYLSDPFGFAPCIATEIHSSLMNEKKKAQELIEKFFTPSEKQAKFFAEFEAKFFVNKPTQIPSEKTAEPPMPKKPEST